MFGGIIQVLHNANSYSHIDKLEQWLNNHILPNQTTAASEYKFENRGYDDDPVDERIKVKLQLLRYLLVEFLYHLHVWL